MEDELSLQGIIGIGEDRRNLKRSEPRTDLTGINIISDKNTGLDIKSDNSITSTYRKKESE